MTLSGAFDTRYWFVLPTRHGRGLCWLSCARYGVVVPIVGKALGWVPYRMHGTRLWYQPFVFVALYMALACVLRWPRNAGFCWPPCAWQWVVTTTHQPVPCYIGRNEAFHTPENEGSCTGTALTVGSTRKENSVGQQQHKLKKENRHMKTFPQESPPGCWQEGRSGVALACTVTVGNNKGSACQIPGRGDVGVGVALSSLLPLHRVLGGCARRWSWYPLSCCSTALCSGVAVGARCPVFRWPVLAVRWWCSCFARAHSPQPAGERGRVLLPHAGALFWGCQGIFRDSRNMSRGF